MIRDTLGEILRQQGATVLCAADGEEALTLYRAESASFDLVLMDMVMPRRNGADCLRAMAEIDNGLRAIVCSGYAPEGELDRIPPEILCERLLKPIRTGELLQAVARALGLLSTASGERRH